MKPIQLNNLIVLKRNDLRIWFNKIRFTILGLQLWLSTVHQFLVNAMSDGKLTTHILDTMQGCPATNVAIELWLIGADDQKTLLKSVRTNQDGRTDSPLLIGEEFQPGTYELVFAIGDYFSQRQIELPQPRFLDRVPIRFGIADASSHYHVPLLASPWSYTTYRGS